MLKFPHYKQADQKDCGSTCIKIVAKHYSKTLYIQTLRNLAETLQKKEEKIIEDNQQRFDF